MLPACLPAVLSFASASDFFPPDFIPPDSSPAACRRCSRILSIASPSLVPSAATADRGSCWPLPCLPSLCPLCDFPAVPRPPAFPFPDWSPLACLPAAVLPFCCPSPPCLPSPCLPSPCLPSDCLPLPPLPSAPRPSPGPPAPPASPPCPCDEPRCLLSPACGCLPPCWLPLAAPRSCPGCGSPCWLLLGCGSFCCGLFCCEPPDRPAFCWLCSFGLCSPAASGEPPEASSPGVPCPLSGDPCPLSGDPCPLSAASPESPSRSPCLRSFARGAGFSGGRGGAEASICNSFQGVCATFGWLGRVSTATPRYSSLLPAPAPSRSGTSCSTPLKAPLRSLRGSTISGCAAPPCTRVSMPTRARPKSGSSARTRTVTGAPGGTRAGDSRGSSIEISGARSANTSILCSSFSTSICSRPASAVPRGWKSSR